MGEDVVTLQVRGHVAAATLCRPRLNVDFTHALPKAVDVPKALGKTLEKR